MKSVAVLAAAVPLAAALAASPVRAAEPLRVYFTTATPPAAQGDFKTQAQKLKGERDAAWATYDVAFKQLEKANGKKYDKWPAEVKEQAALSYQTYVGKGLDYLLFTIKPKELEDSVRDISNSVAGKGLAGVKENVVLAESAADAHLVVEAIARYGASKLTVGPKFFFYRVSAGGKLKPEALKAVPSEWPKPGWWSDEPCTQYHRFRDEEPYLVFMTVNDQRWRDVMNIASGCINELVKVHGAALTSAP
jgi:hypothetical protein